MGELQEMTITKAYLAEQVRQKHGNLSRQEALSAVDAIWNITKAGLFQGQNMHIKGFGKFIVRSQAARVGRNINTKQAVPISARRVVVFKPSKRLKELVNGD
jgi:integration host factor subunit alpha